MGDYRGGGGGGGRRGQQRNKNWNRRPPSGHWGPGVPSWEKDFCTLECSMPWWKICKTHKTMHLYDDIMQWDDSAGAEAFYDAKNRYWAKINGIPCDIPDPNPDMYIDDVDWDSYIDPELIRSLEEELVAKQMIEPVLQNAVVIPTGWDDTPCDVIPCSGWGDDNEVGSQGAGVYGLPKPDAIGSGWGDVDEAADYGDHALQKPQLVYSGWDDVEEVQTGKVHVQSIPQGNGGCYVQTNPQPTGWGDDEAKHSRHYTQTKSQPTGWDNNEIQHGGQYAPTKLQASGRGVDEIRNGSYFSLRPSPVTGWDDTWYDENGRERADYERVGKSGWDTCNFDSWKCREAPNPTPNITQKRNMDFDDGRGWNRGHRFNKTTKYHPGYDERFHTNRGCNWRRQDRPLFGK